jgi:hypothetical protein
VSYFVIHVEGNTLIKIAVLFQGRCTEFKRTRSCDWVSCTSIVDTGEERGSVSQNVGCYDDDIRYCNSRPFFCV